MKTFPGDIEGMALRGARKGGSRGTLTSFPSVRGARVPFSSKCFFEKLDQGIF